MKLFDTDRRNRAVSDLIAFTLVFSVVISSIGIVAFGGLDALEQARNGAEVNTAEATTVGYARTLAEHVDDGAPRRETTIKLQGHSLRTEESTFEVRVDEVGTWKTVEPGRIVRTTTNGAQLVYSNGAVFRIPKNGGLRVVRQPPFRCTGTDAYVSFLLLDGTIDTSSSNRVTLRSNLDDQTLYYPNSSARTASTSAVSIDITNLQDPYRSAWERVFDRYLTEWSETSPGSNVYRCDGIRRGVVKETTVAIEAIY